MINIVSLSYINLVLIFIIEILFILIELMISFQNYNIYLFINIIFIELQGQVVCIPANGTI